MSILVLAALSLTAVSSASSTDGGVSEVDALRQIDQVSNGDDSANDDEAVDRDLDDMRVLEDAAVDTSSRSAAAIQLTLEQLGYGSLARERLEAALETLETSGDDFFLELPTVTNISNFDIASVKSRYDIPIEMQPLVIDYIRFFQNGGRKWFRRWMSRSYRYIPLMQPILEAKGLPRDTVYLAMIESGFNTQAKSWASAVGPWQFISATGKLFKLGEDFWIDERRDPIKATHAAADYLSLLHSKLGHWYLAWAGYNAGGGRVRRLIDTHGTSNFWELSEKKRKGFARETKHYVPKLIACAIVAKHPEAFGFSESEFEPEGPFEFDEVSVVGAVDLEVLAQASNTTVDVLHELNPELKRWCTPPTTSAAPYVLRIPKGSRTTFLANFDRLGSDLRLHFKIHRVRRGDTISKLAAQYRSAPEAIIQLNALAHKKPLKLNVDLMIPVPQQTQAQVAGLDANIVRQVSRARRQGITSVNPSEEVPAGTAPKSAVRRTGQHAARGGSLTSESVNGKRRVTYHVAQGDSLWTIARRFDVRVEELNRWNHKIASVRGLKVGAALVIWPGANADISPDKR